MFSVNWSTVFSFWLALKIAVTGLYIGTGLKLFDTWTDEIQCKIARAFVGTAGVGFSLTGNEALSSLWLQRVFKAS